MRKFVIFQESLKRDVVKCDVCFYWLSFLLCRILVSWSMVYNSSIVYIYSFKWILHLFGLCCCCGFFGFGLRLFFFWLGNHEYPKDNWTLKISIFNIIFIGRKSGGKKVTFSSQRRENCHLVSPFLGWWSKITLANDLLNLSCQLEYLQRILGCWFRTAICTFIFVLILLYICLGIRISKFLSSLLQHHASLQGIQSL